ncbi:transcriptional regulator [Burkholderia ubonensis]|uniref:transcriptional regulator n=1 Tax=Burkholderia ubonensis TaxID=101571 RepID=UPI00076DC624|nr:transcriptional regulator [Burkholderia ubonensis]KUZ76878.1 transcriptional regulator [Burkholderia ubonensis]
MSSTVHVEIRPECLQPAIHWASPTGAEIQEVVRRTGMSHRAVSRFLGLADTGGRQVRRWIANDAAIPYSTWALLCDAAGLGQIWRIDTEAL